MTALRRRGPVRWSLLGVLALVQAFVLFSAVMWWLGSSAPSATATVAPMTWTGVVYDVGAAGVNMRSAAQVRPDDSRDTAARGARLALACGQTGDVVAKGPVKTATWLRTTDGLFVSMLYVRVPDKASIPSCNGSKVDGPLLALADPAHPELPPPPGTQLGAQSKAAPDAASSGHARGSTEASGPSVALAPNGTVGGATEKPQNVPYANGANTPPTTSVDLGQGTGVGRGQAAPSSVLSPPTEAPPTDGARPAATHAVGGSNPDVTPVG